MDKKIQLRSIYSEILNEFNEPQEQKFLKRQEETRRNLITQIQDLRMKQSGRATKVISYYAKLDFPIQNEVMINQWDVKSVYSLLSEIPNGSDIELIINTLGGLPQKTRQIIDFVRAKLGRKNTFRVIVPEIAKSAGTLICLGADLLTVGEPSELGPIDPQIPRYSPGGQVEYISAWTYVNSFEMLQNESKDEKGNLKQEFYPLLANFDLPFYERCKQALKQIEEDARELLASGMMKKKKTQSDIDDIASYFLGGGKPHDSLITGRQIVKKLGRRYVEYLNTSDNLWKLYWELHCRSFGLLDKTSIVKFVEYDAGVLTRQVLINPR
ncbi:MAG: Periplasmic serine protease [uncultured bacterium]|uniref:Peptidase n=1 Tax=Candidatus Curtissbacteria bacterium RIFOXYA1_FULL_41_14 TaxID=1797737 RepID=A0A1F5HFK2_9BACT|nr:MAG: Periplasmic serine protease [uncultured bacterium]KKR64182.1 MAG: Periplasmic serine protease (ClpP class) [Candidatus Curtissbacteria bacterium GW2011_GWA1_40_47]KKS01347.1 MAG: Periplasmic serine protease (ClpP class) [Candidatus Curtissbacteria bacterium GW2011_GWC2_41_21]OGD91311.1 MAG: hypothetical protein A3E14_02320 [Candidatus Curtissbacteria bacterium RIFCSPHIGHO2_12_FULL_41_13]OGE02927.1 MAG: hypothetical protein A2196_03650 [Candidatus Curtissbacteria bacterium RIFOXYA1_FULL_